MSFHAHVLGILERQEGHEVGVVDDKGFGSALDQVAFGCVGRDDVANLVGHAALEGQGYPGERVSQRFSALALAAYAVGADFVFKEFANVSQNRAGDYMVFVYTQGRAEE